MQKSIKKEKKEVVEMKKIPYGMSNFRAMREEGYLYVDKTMYIEKIENLNSKYLFFIRPRRFGKSLFLSTLENYYDINNEKDFEKLFGDLYIGKKPTKLKNSYMILKLNFSGLNTENKDQLKESFLLSVKNSINALLGRYEGILGNTEEIREKIDQITDINAVIMTLINEVKKVGKKIYLIIDEYDHFANDIIAMGESEFYREIVRASGFVRDFYETLKIGTESVIDRIFITGISPIMLDDLTSGFNIALNVTMDLSLNEMLGFTEEEVVKILEEVGIEEKENLINNLRELYDGYKFNKNAKTRVYNPDMVLYFLAQYKNTGGYPEYLIDDNVKTDYGRLNRLTMNEENKALLERIIKEEGIVAEIVTKFSFDRMYDEEYFISLLFYMGLLTIKDYRYNILELGIPNYVIKTMYWEYFSKKLKEENNIKYEMLEIAKAIWEMAFEGKIKNFVKFISEKVLKVLSNRDTIKFDEKYIKIILFSYLTMSNIYKLISEKETEGGYIDIYLEKDIRMPDVKYEWLIELKYVKKSDEKYIEEIREKGKEQLKRYRESMQFKDKQNLKKALVVFIGKGDYKIFEE